MVRDILLLCLVGLTIPVTSFGQVVAPVDPDLGVITNSFLGSACLPLSLDTLDNGDLLGVGHTVGMAFRTDRRGAYRDDFGRHGAIMGNGAMYLSRVAVHPDGKHWVLVRPGGWTYTLNKSGIDGLPDVGFGSNGSVEFDPAVVEYDQMVSLPDERVVLAGQDATSDAFRMTRLLVNGAVDASFGAGGVVSLGTHHGCLQMQRLSDGRLFCLTRDGVGDQALLMFTTDGALDTTWMGDGVMEHSSGDFGLDFVQRMHFMPDGRILLGGKRPWPQSECIMVMVLEDGITVDPGFNAPVTTGGVNMPWFKVMTDGSIFRPSNPGSAIVQHLLPDGQLDTAFGVNGQVTLNGFTAFSGITQRVGHWLAFGSYGTAQLTKFGIRALNPDGTTSEEIMSGGTTFYNPHDENMQVGDVAVDSSGRFTGVGTHFGQGGWVARLDSTGVPDSTFAQQGCWSGGSHVLSFVRNLPGGQVLALGRTAYGGSLSLPVQMWFNHQGVQMNAGTDVFDGDVSNFQYLKDAVLTPGQKVYVMVDVPGSSIAHCYVARLNLDGTFDTTFASGGVFTEPYLPLWNAGFCVGLFPNDDVLAVQHVQGSLGTIKLQLRRLSSAGVPVTSWGVGGVIRTDLLGTGSISIDPIQVKVLPDGRFLLLYASDNSLATSQLNVAMFLESGSLDPSFGINGIVADIGTPFYYLNPSPEMVVQTDGAITVGYNVPSPGGSNTRLLRLSANGLPDLSFGPGGFMDLGAQSGSDLVATQLTLDGQDRVVVSGQFLIELGNTRYEWILFRLPEGLVTGTTAGSSSDDGHTVNVFPNPASHELNVELRVDRAVHVRSRLFDMQGRAVADLGAMDLAEGTRSYRFYRPSSMPDGVYMLQLACDQWSRLIPVVLQR
jgi:uncharacterized delta-60 repeat protein